MPILQSELRILSQWSVNRCAVERCGELLTRAVEDSQGPTVRGHVAHIIGQSRQRPRGDHELAEADPPFLGQGHVPLGGRGRIERDD